MKGLKRLGDLQVVKRTDIPPIANFMCGIFSLATQQAERAHPTPKARFVDQCFRNHAKGVLLHTSSIVHASSTQFLSTLLCLFRMRFWGLDVTQMLL